MLNYAYLTAALRITLKTTDDPAALSAQVQQGLNALRESLGVSATIAVTSDSDYSADPATTAAEMARLKNELAAANVRIAELQKPVAIPHTVREMASGFSKQKHLNVLRRAQITPEAYSDLYMEASALAAANAQLVAEMSKPRTSASSASSTGQDERRPLDAAEIAAARGRVGF